MNKEFKNFLIFLFIGAVLMVGAYYLIPYLEEKEDLETSDAGDLRGTIKIGVDNWIGYFPLCGKEVKKRLRGYGYGLKCIDDNADYGKRFGDLKNAKLDLAVATVDSFLLNGAKLNFPGSIVTVIDESKGGDALVAKTDKIKSLQELKDSTDIKIAFTPDSPSSHLLKSIAVHFDIPFLSEKSGWQLETDGSNGALKALKSGKADLAVLWEPDVSQALKLEGVTKLLGTENTSKLIVDILIASKGVLLAEPEKVQALLQSYYQALKLYNDDPALLQKEISSKNGQSNSEISAMLEGVEWKNLTDNSLEWFGISQGSELGYEGLIDAIESALEILEKNDGFSSSSLPSNDPYRLLNRKFVENLYGKLSKGQFGKSLASKDKVNTFRELSSKQWKELREVGTLRIRPITFQSGTASLDNTGKLELDKLANNLKHYPNFRILVRGHTGTSGDSEANLVLSDDRAESVAKYLKITHEIQNNRIRSVGLGSSEPLPRLRGESFRAYKYRLPRVELQLLAETF